MNLATMNRPFDEAETSYLESMRSHYEESGYTFIVHPQSTQLPEFLAGYLPDAIACRPGENIAIELKSRASANQQSLQRIGKLFEGRPDWKLTVAYMGNAAIDAHILPVLSRPTVLEQVEDVELLMEQGNLRAAFMLAWSLLEAALNSVRPNLHKQPRTPGTVVQTLAMDGLISEQSDRSLRSLVELRNRVVHGDLTAEPTRADVQTVLEAVRAVLV
ncbi:MAG: hypothetical protein Q8Q62_07335 [Mesorhizobium sp.]|nr:hypothetical protein [Mesorhizobium sp.]